MKQPLMRDLPGDHVIAFDRGGVITVAELLDDIARLAVRLPDQSHVLNDCNDRYHFLVSFAAAMVRGQVSLFPGNRVAHVWEQVREDYPNIYCLTDQNEVPEAMPLFRYRREAANVPAARAPVPAFPSSQLAAIAFTSGSTGRPKPFIRYWGAFVREARVGGQALALDAARGGALVATVPPQHMYGFLASILLPLSFGYALYRGRPFYPEDIRLALEASPRRPVLVTTPVQLRACVMEQTRFPALDFILSSAAPLPRVVADEAEERFHTRVFEYYGSTETGAIACRRQAESDVWHVFEEVRVDAQESGFRVTADYFAEPVVLNDVVEVLSPREFRLLGRNADLIKIGGKRTSLMYLNQQLQEIAGVADGAFLLEEARDGREPRLAAFVVAPGQTREQILTALRARVDEVFLPRRLWLVAALPRNAAGKLPRDHMQKLLQEAQAQDAAPGNP
jgi:acyl-coenzyme A synthetase/AMP-(fatty) acid ligase